LGGAEKTGGREEGEIVVTFKLAAEQAAELAVREGAEDSAPGKFWFFIGFLTGS